MPRVRPRPRSRSNPAMVVPPPVPPTPLMEVNADCIVAQEALHRWLSTRMVKELLTNYQAYGFVPHTGSPAVKPPSGALYLYDRSVVKNFRKDGHNWKKKKDGKTVREDHERLKIDGVPEVACCYAHSEELRNFHRRVYWVLSGQTHVVLVHYLCDAGREQSNSLRAPRRRSRTTIVSRRENPVSGLTAASSRSRSYRRARTTVKNKARTSAGRSMYRKSQSYSFLPTPQEANAAPSRAAFTKHSSLRRKRLSDPPLPQLGDLSVSSPTSGTTSPIGTPLRSHSSSSLDSFMHSLNTLAGAAHGLPVPGTLGGSSSAHSVHEMPMYRAGPRSADALSDGIGSMTGDMDMLLDDGARASENGGGSEGAGSSGAPGTLAGMDPNWWGWDSAPGAPGAQQDTPGGASSDMYAYQHNSLLGMAILEGPEFEQDLFVHDDGDTPVPPSLTPTTTEFGLDAPLDYLATPDSVSAVDAFWDFGTLHPLDAMGVKSEVPDDVADEALAPPVPVPPPASAPAPAPATVRAPPTQTVVMAPAVAPALHGGVVNGTDAMSVVVKREAVEPADDVAAPSLTTPTLEPPAPHTPPMGAPLTAAPAATTSAAGVMAVPEIVDFSPHWDFTRGGAKMLLSATNVFAGVRYECVFDTLHVAAEVLPTGALRVTVPPHSAGVVDLFLVTSAGTRSSTHQFEYRPVAQLFPYPTAGVPEHVSMQMRLVEQLVKMQPGGGPTGIGASASMLAASQQQQQQQQQQQEEQQALQQLSHITPLPTHARGEWTTRIEQVLGKPTVLRTKAGELCPRKLNSLLLHLLRRVCVHTLPIVTMHGGEAINVPDRDGATLLHMVCGLGSPALVSLVLRAGGDVHATDKHKRTPLHWAVGGNHGDTVRVLLDAGARVYVHDSTGASPVSMAHENGLAALEVQLLDSAGTTSDEAASEPRVVRRLPKRRKRSSSQPPGKRMSATSAAHKGKTRPVYTYDDYERLRAAEEQVTVLQAYVRRWLARKEYVHLRAAAMSIQAATRGMFARREYDELRRATSTLQSAARSGSSPSGGGGSGGGGGVGGGGESSRPSPRVAKAAHVLQEALQGMVARRRYKEIWETVGSVKAVLGGFRARADSAVVIQEAWREHHARRADSARVIQEVWRKHRAQQQRKQAKTGKQAALRGGERELPARPKMGSSSGKRRGKSRSDRDMDSTGALARARQRRSTKRRRRRLSV